MAFVFDKTKYPHIPEELGKSLNGYPEKNAKKILELLWENNWDFCEKQAIKPEQIDGIEIDLEEILNQDSIEKIKKDLETILWIKIYLWEKKQNSESNNIGYISLYKNNQEVWEIWTDLYCLWHDVYIDSHLWVQIYGDNEWKWYGKLLYKLYKRWSELDKNIFFPEEEYATKNSRILLLKKMWYELDSVYDGYDFKKLNEEEKKIILGNAKKDYYFVQDKIYKFIYIWDAS